MEPQRFDDMARAAGGRATRRAAVAGLLGALLPFVAAAQNKRDKPNQRDKQNKEDGPAATGRGEQDGPSAKACRRRGKRLCGKQCRDLQTDPKHCGECGNRCQSRERCVRGRCLLGSTECGATGDLCYQNSDCCSSNCFNNQCGPRVATCGTGGGARQCVPPARGCDGNECCYGAAACGDTCCTGTANQCNPNDECCAPNCAGRQCGDDGCGAGGTCGTCGPNQQCNTTTGRCVSDCTPDCTGLDCGPDGCGGVCGYCPAGQSCDNGTCCTLNCAGKTCGDDGCGGSCGDCDGDAICCDGQCVNGTDNSNCYACGVVCTDPAICDSGYEGCCNPTTNPLDNACSATIPCCDALCVDGRCCDPDGRVTCYTDQSRCCGTCVPFDSNCTGHCPGQCSGNGSRGGWPATGGRGTWLLARRSTGNTTGGGVDRRSGLRRCLETAVRRVWGQDWHEARTGRQEPAWFTAVLQRFAVELVTCSAKRWKM